MDEIELRLLHAVLELEISYELNNQRFEGRSHFSRNLYAEGCHGPLCTYRERLKAARRYAARNPHRKARPRPAVAIERDKYLDEVLDSILPDGQRTLAVSSEAS